MIRRFLVVIVALIATTTYAQNNAASPYSFYGIGDLQFRGTVENRMMGGISLFADSIHVNINNPATYAKLKLTSFTIGATRSSLNLETEDAKESASSTSINYFAIGVPLGNMGGFGFGVLPYTSVGYKLQGLNNDGTILNQFEGQGGVNKAFFSYGLPITDGFSIGATANYNFGKIENRRTTIIENVELATKQVDESSLSGFDFDLAANYDRRMGEDYLLTALFKIKPQANITSRNTREISTLTVSAAGTENIRETAEIDLGVLTSSDLTLPQAMTFGLGFGKDKSWFLGAEYSILDNEELGRKLTITENAVYEDGSRFSAGGFYIPKHNSFSSYWSRVVYRAGIRYEETGLRLNNVPLNDFGMSFGVGLPVAGISNVNVGFEFGKRGTTFAGRIEENYFNLNISLSLSDKWFIKRKYN
jgi:hypothetical protein